MCGSLGGGHGHFGKLHLDLSYEGEDVLIDTGRYTYVDGTLRRTLKSAKAHNVPMADDREYTECTGSWNVRNAAAYAGMRAVQKGSIHCLREPIWDIWMRESMYAEKFCRSVQRFR